MLVEVNLQALNTLSITEPLRHLMLSVCLEMAVKFGVRLKSLETRSAKKRVKKGLGELVLYVVFADGAVFLDAVSKRVAAIAQPPL